MNIGKYFNAKVNKDTRKFDLLIQVLILLSIISFSISTIPDLSSNTKYALEILELVIVVVFTIEYLLRIYFAPKKLAYIFSFWGFIDLLAILPYLLAVGLDLRSLRIFRLLRIFTVLKLLRYSKALNHLKVAFISIKEELFMFSMFSFIFIYLSAVGIYHFENEAQPDKFCSVIDSLWWSIGTLTTVGYGDVYPVTAGGKIFTFFLLIIGLGIVAIPSGLIASALTQTKRK